MEVFIMRHAIAEDHSASGRDRDRELTREGQEKTRLAASSLRAIGVKLELVLTSPYSRAHETARLVAEGLKLERRLEICEALACGGATLEVVREVEKRSSKAERILLVGHEPDLSQLISLYIAGGMGARVLMKKGSIAKITFELEPTPGEGTLEWLLAPKQLVALGSNG